MKRPSLPPFPPLTETERLQRLQPPPPGVRLPVVLDTDAANEIDDPFAIAWALLAPERLDVLACLAAPFSFEYRRQEVLRARHARQHPAHAREEDRELLQLHAHQLAWWEQQGWDPATVQLAPLCAPEVGMQRSLGEIESVYRLLGLPSVGRAFAGSTRYLRRQPSQAQPGSAAQTDPAQAPLQPETSPATTRLLELAAMQPDARPLYVLAIGCLTNIANALLLQPELVRRLVVVWTAGYPSHAPQVNRAFNLEQDLLATQVVLDSGVPLVYLPGYHVGAQLRLSLPEMQRHVQGCGAMGAHLYQLYTDNPLWPLLGVDPAHALQPQAAYSWVIWDLINVAWLLQSDWVPTDLVSTPRIASPLRWQRDAQRPLMREAYAVQRDAIFNDFFTRLRTAP
jgi:purine nucleosidase